MRKQIIVLWLIATAPLSLNAQELFSPTGLDAVTNHLGQTVRDRQMTALIAALEVDGEVEWLLASGEMEPGVPMRTDPIMPLASIGKMFTATAAMVLLERGDISLDDSVSRFIPEFSQAMVAIDSESDKQVVPASRPMTVRHLLTHTAGFVVEGDRFWEVWDRHVGKTNTTEFAKDLLSLNLNSHPGDQFDYGQTGAAYEVLGAVIEIASGQTLEEFMAENLFRPLNLTDSYFYLPSEKSERLPAIYHRSEDGLVLDRPAGEDFSRSTFFHGGGGVRTSPADLFRFARMLMNGGEVDGIRLLKTETVNMMMADQLGELAPESWKPRGLSWGFGAAVTYSEENRDSGIPDQYGWVGGGFSKLWIDPRNQLIAYINVALTPPGDNDLLREYEKLVYAAMNES